jgi:hypothetical protein
MRLTQPQHFYIRMSNPAPRNPTGPVEEAGRARCVLVVLTDAGGAPLSDEKHRIKLGPEDDALVLAQRMLRSRVLSKPRWPHRGAIEYPDQGIA